MSQDVANTVESRDAQAQQYAIGMHEPVTVNAFKAGWDARGACVRGRMACDAEIDRLKATCEELTKTNKHLREALEQIAEIPSDCFEQRTARQALAEQEGRRNEQK